MRLVQVLALTLLTLNAASATFDEPVVRKDLTPNDLSAYVERLTSNGQIITDLNVRVVDRRAVFDVMSQANPDKRPWLIQVNIGDKEFSSSSRKYKADGFRNTVHRYIPNGREKLHSTTWVQNVEAADSLKVPRDPIPVTGRLGQDLAPINDLLVRTLKDNNIPGATVAVSRDGLIIYERGFGYSDLKMKTLMIR